MPYISQNARERLRPFLIGLPQEIRTAGELAYVVTKLMHEFWRRDPTFDNWARTRGAVEDQIDEMRRRLIAVYEDQKMRENGDV